MGLHSSADIVISGGGLVGTACAAAIAKLDVTKKKKILLLESSKKREITMGEKYSNRVSALNPGSVKMLEQLGAWSTVPGHRANPIHNMQVWEACSDASISFGGEAGAPLSYLVENDVTQLGLNTALQDLNNVTVIHGCKVSKYRIPAECGDATPADKVEIFLSNGDVIETQLLIGADGNRSLVRESLGGENMSWEYNQMGVVGTLELAEETENHTAFQRFLPTGPIAILPLSSRYSSLVWSMPTNQAREMLQLSGADLVRELETGLWESSAHNGLVNTAATGLDYILRSFAASSSSSRSQLPPRIKGVENVAGFPLGFGHSPRYAGPRTLLIGDAAHRVHPLAGQGVNLGFGDVDTLSTILDRSLREGLSLGNTSWLLDYETERQRHNVPTMLAIDSLHRLYSSTFTPIVLARTLGLQVTDALTPLKKMLVNHAAG